MDGGAYSLSLLLGLTEPHEKGLKDPPKNRVAGNTALQAYQASYVLFETLPVIVLLDSSLSWPWMVERRAVQLDPWQLDLGRTNRMAPTISGWRIRPEEDNRSVVSSVRLCLGKIQASEGRDEEGLAPLVWQQTDDRGSDTINFRGVRGFLIGHRTAVRTGMAHHSWLAMAPPEARYCLLPGSASHTENPWLALPPITHCRPHQTRQLH